METFTAEVPVPRKRPPASNPKFTITSLSSIDREVWDDFIALHSPGNLLQSYAWGDFKHLMGDTVLRYGLLYQQEIVGAAQIVIHKRLLGGSTASLARGPVMAGTTPKLMLYFVEHLSQICHASLTTDLIVEPLLPDVPVAAWAQLGFRPTSPVQPGHTTQIDLNASDLMATFKPKTRYNIRLAEKKEVQISASTEKKGLEELYRLLMVTAGRQGVSFYPLDYYQTLFDTFSPTGDIVIMTARHEDDILASLLLVFYQNTAFYLFGGTDDLKREYMANYLLHYGAMKFAREKGAQRYDFWGVALPGDPLAEKWAGITRFKLGFSGSLVQYPSAWRRIYHPFWPRVRSLLSALRTIPSFFHRHTA
ncbi:hypothetical protein AUK40_03545 [Candidatus Wirthbacteria bacterium CG2_30_54_11]|uniref:BioF2-like acetyltransferase domain-containing protein n=1 Tax=Candidatus Wirthbacteria bacterium CG2_30_54_11 TaxID=1817892 RepID=A0A1J5IJR1_9BACT|nr:MAG: hypothetical protein AUK40_03545 [Candidatus Wirthbacteria bacterium CG2_30_54_11]